MNQPNIDVINTSRSVVDVFGGYNHNLKISDGEFYDMENLSSDAYPLLSSCRPRGTFETNPAEEHKFNGLIAKDKLCYVDGSKFYIGDWGYEMGLTSGNVDRQKELVSMGAYVIILPDKKYINTINPQDRGNIEASWNHNGGITYAMCQLDGTDYTNVVLGGEPPSEPNNGAYWIDSSQEVYVMRRWSKASNQWGVIPTTYIKITAPNIAKDFQKGDGVKLVGLHDDNQLKALEGKISIIQELHHNDDGVGDYIIVTGILGQTTAINSSNKLYVTRRMPIIDFCIEAGNRLWGCHYGIHTDEDGNDIVVNEIYASKLGDFKNWNCYNGTSTDSYTASCGTDGRWTGAINFFGSPIFFKENYIHKVSGSFPANFQIQTLAGDGVQFGCARSVAIVGDKVFYKGKNGVCVYDNALPTDMSLPFGGIRYNEPNKQNYLWAYLRDGAAAGSINNKYYICMKNEQSKLWELFVYDLASGIWNKETGFKTLGFVAYNGELYYIDQDRNEIRTMFGSGKTDTAPVEWYGETGNIGFSMPDRKYISKITVRISLAFDSQFAIYIQYDSSGKWERVWTLDRTSTQSFTVPIKPKRCDHFKMKFVGKGDFKIYSIATTMEQGSDR